MQAESPITLGESVRAYHAFSPSREVPIEEVYRAKIESYHNVVTTFWSRTGLRQTIKPPPINQGVWEIISGNGMLCYLPESDKTYDLLDSLFPSFGIKKAVEEYGIVDEAQSPGWFDTEMGTYQPHRWIANGIPASEDEVLTRINNRGRSPATLAHYISAILLERVVFGKNLSGIVVPDQTLLIGSKTNKGESIIGQMTNKDLLVDSSSKDGIPNEVNIRSIKAQV